MSLLLSGWLGLGALILFHLSPPALSSITIAIECTNGVIIGTDSVSSFGSDGQSLIQNRFSTSVFPVDGGQLCLCYISGGAEFHSLLEDILSTSLDFRLQQQSSHTFDDHSRLGVQAVSNVARRLMHTKYRKTHVLVVGRQDDSFAVYELLPGGTSVRQPIAASGTAAAHAYALASLLFEEPCNVEEGIPRLKTVLQRSIGQDHRAKGRLRVFSLTAQGLEETS